jgi:uncharacterized protein (TIGR02569 family)
VAQPLPSAEILRAFGIAEGPLQPLAGGISQTAFRVGDAVVKFAQDPAENEWSAAVFDAIEEDGFRVHRPIRSRDGSFLVDGWLAWHWVEGEHERSDWGRVIEAADALHRAIPPAMQRIGRPTRPTWLDARTHRWAVAEAVVWHDAPLPERATYDIPEFALWERARALGRPLTAEEQAESQVVHGDVCGNALTTGGFEWPCFIDMSPGWRPASSVSAQVAVEAVAWRGGDDSLLDGFTAPAMARALAFRVMCGLQAVFVGDQAGGFPPKETAAFTRLLDLIGA